ncbi:MAG: orotidine-5'-phosphate decarboxylase [Endomicrobia bacterium]|nr:orotidine-5'-phosphate decarboxylase [Endomicrobiia bacterium]MDW8056545.1 orotidine-5'-phosphate decarboxylase [Elusimicrobiota bacterium]
MNTKVVIALDIEEKKAKDIVDIALKYGFDLFKVGHLLFDTHPEIIDYITSSGGKVILDLKFNDIPSVIAKAIIAILKKYKIFAFTVHSLGGEQMLKEVVSTVINYKPKPIIFAVTVLTSLSKTDLKIFGFKTDVKTTVVNLAKLAKKTKVDGVVCSPKEVRLIKETCGEKFLTLVPGVSLGGKNIDQKRTDTIEKVVKYGADFIVLGRTIYESKNVEIIFKNLSIFLNQQ